MYVIREVLNCAPGKVRPLLEKFRSLSEALEARGVPPLRLLTDVSGPPFWTLVSEVTVERVEEFFAVEEELMADPEVRAAMAGYRDLIVQGRREIYRLES